MKCQYEGHECDCFGEVKERHRNTAYHFSDEDCKAGKPDPNLMISCQAHYDIDYENFQAMWDEYYSSVRC